MHTTSSSPPMRALYKTIAHRLFGNSSVDAVMSAKSALFALAYDMPEAVARNYGASLTKARELGEWVERYVHGPSGYEAFGEDAFWEYMLAGPVPPELVWASEEAADMRAQRMTADEYAKWARKFNLAVSAVLPSVKDEDRGGNG